MWKRIVAWHRGWEAEQLRVLAEPAHAAEVEHGYRRRLADKMAAMTPIERAQLREFALKYSGWRGYAATGKLLLLFSAVGVVLHLLFPTKSLLAMLVVANVIGLAGVLTFAVAYFNYRNMVGKFWRITLILVVCASAGALAGASHAARDKGIPFAEALEARWLKAMLMGAGAGLFFAVPMAIVGALRNQQYHTLAAQLELDAERHRAARELSESRLRMLHAQIEPHFLFNTLGAVQQLAEKDAPRAAELTASLIAFLRSSLDEMRSERVTLAADFGLVEAYLQVMTARLGNRLRFDLALAPGLGSVTVPSMMLLTLVENAIKHGIEPALRGGAVQVSACREGDMLRLSVRDTGAGMAEAPGAGDGLANIRSRLQLIYAGQAALTVAEAPDGGVLAEIVLPFNDKENAA
ncbi:MAG: histidine kinase [Pseudomonadota bacterium]